MTGVGRCDYVGRLRNRLQHDDIAHAFLVLSCRYICERHLTPSQILASTSRTDAANHLLPRAGGIPRSLSALAMARSEVAPLACSSAITCARSPPRAQLRPLRWRLRRGECALGSQAGPGG